MKVKDIAKLGKLLAQFLTGFACCFARPADVLSGELLTMEQVPRAVNVFFSQPLAYRLVAENNFIKKKPTARLTTPDATPKPRASPIFICQSTPRCVWLTSSC